MNKALALPRLSKVWIMENNKPTEKTIKSILLTFTVPSRPSETSKITYYILDDTRTGFWYTIDGLYLTREELIASL